MGIRLTLVLGLMMLAAAPVLAQTQAQTEPPEKARRYLDMLRKRPQFGVVFERFLDAWYEASTPDELGKHLIAVAAKPEAKAGDHLLLALFETRRGNEADAVTAFKKGLAADPGNPPAWQELARLQVRMLDFTQALDSLDKALQQKPDKTLAVEIEKQRGRVLLRTGKPEDALTAWRKLLEAHADDEDLAEEVVDVQLDEGLYTEAVALMKSLIDKTKDAYTKVTRRMRLADIYLRAGMKAEALEQLSEVVRQSGYDTWIESEALAQTDQIFRREDNLSGLAGHLEKLATAEDKRVAIKRHLARVQAETGLKDQAFATYKDLLARTPGRRDLREGYLDLLERFGNFTEAIPQTKLLLEQNPGDKELHLRLAAQQQHSGDTKAASASLDAYLAMPGATEYDHLRVAMQLENWGRKDDAKTAFEKLIVTFPQSTSAREAQAHFLHRTGSREQALAIWKELAAKGDQEQVLAVSQALLARQEAKAAHEVLMSRLGEFGKDPRYLAPLLTAAISVKEEKAAVPLALDRVRLTIDPGMLEDSIRQAVQILENAQQVPTTIKSLQGQPALSIAERCLLATLFEESGEKETSERTLREASAEHALLAQTRLVGLIESRQDWPRAAQELEKLIALPEGRNSQHLQRLVDLKDRSGEPEAALKVALEWKTLSPGALQPWLTEAALLTQLNKPQESIKILRAASRKFEDDDNVAAALANAYADAGQFGDAERIFLRLVEKAESLDDKIRWVAALAQAAQSRNAIKDVTANFQERQRRNREDATPWLALAEIARVTNNDAERRRCLVEASRLRPKDIDLLHQIARVEEDTGNFKQAMQTLEKAAALDTGWRTKQAIAMTQLRSGDEETGFRLLGDLMGGSAIDPKDALRLAEAMMARQHWDKAVAFLTPLVAKHPADYRLRYVKAIAQYQSTDASGAITEFLQVAAAKEEVEEVLKKALPSLQSSWEKSYYGNLDKTSPPGTSDIYRTLRAMYEATQYRQRYQRSSTALSSGVKVPKDVSTARRYALANLIQLHADADTAERTRIATSLEASGTGQVKVLLAFEPNEQASWNVTVVEEALEANPSDPLLQMFGVEFNGGSGSGSRTLPIEQCRAAFDVLKEKYPLPAFRAAVAAVKSDTDVGLPMLEKALADMENAKDINASLTSELARMLGGGQNSSRVEQQRIDLPDPLRKKLRAAMVRNFTTQPPAKPGSFDYSILYSANACRAEGAWEDYITLWNHFMKTLREADVATQKSMKAWSYRSSSQNSALLRPLPFPTSDSLPGLFSMMMQFVDPFNPGSQNYARPGPEDDYAAIVPLLDKVEDPSMRIALAYKASQSKRVEEELQARSGRDDVTLDDLLLAASYAGTAGDHERALKLLVRMQAFPMDGARRAEVDAAIVHAVTNLKEKEKMAPFAEAGQQAARRLRSAKLDARQRDELAEAFATLGLKEESEQWKRLAALAPTPQPQRGSSGGYSRQTSRTRVEKALAKNDPAEAIKAVVAELRTIRSSYWDGNSGYAVQEGATLMRRLNFPDAKTKLVAALNPGLGAALARQEEYASLLEIAGEKVLARQVYEDLVQKHPDSYISRIRLLVLMAPTDPQKAITLLETVPLKAFNQALGYIIVELSNDSNMTTDVRAALFNAMSAVLEKHAGDEAARRMRTDLDWVQELPAMLARRTYGGGKSLPYLYDRDPYDDKRYNYVKPDAPELKVRRAAMDRLCKAMMLYPRLAPSAFAWHAGLVLHEGGNVEELAALATELVAKSKAFYSSGQMPTPLQPRRYSAYEEITALWRPQPAEFLVWRAWKNGQASTIESEILPAVQQSMDRSEFALLKTRVRVWTSEPQDFSDSAETFLRTATAGSSGSGYRQLEHAVWLVDRWDERKLRGPVLDKPMISLMKGTSSYNEGSYFQLYLETRAKLAPEADTAAFIQQVIATYLGSHQNRWPERMSAFVSTRYGRGGSFNDRDAYNVGTMLSTLAERPKTKAAALQGAIITGLINHGEWMRNTIAQNINEVGEDAGLSMAFLQEAGFFNEATTIRVLNEQNIVHNIFSVVRGKPEVRKAMGEALKSKPRTFGVDLTEVMLQQNVDAALTEFIKRRSFDLATIPADRVPGLASLIRLNVSATAKNMATLDPVMKEALKPIFAGELAEQKGLLEKWMTAKKMQELQIDDEKYEQELVKKFIELSTSDRKKAGEFFNHACKLMEAKQATEDWNNYTASNGWTLRSEMLSRAIKESPKLRMLGLSMQLFHEDVSGNLTMHGWSHDCKWGQALHDAWKQGGGAINTGSSSQAMLTALQEELGDTPHTLLPLAFYDFYTRLPLTQRIPTLQWAEKAASDPAMTALSALAKELALAGRFFLATDPGARGNADMQKALAELGGVHAVWQHEIARLRDEKLHPRARLALTHHLCYRAPESIPVEVAAVAGQLSLDAQQKLQCMHGYQYGWLLKAWCRLPADDAWKNLAQAHWAAWQKRNALLTPGENPVYDPHDWPILNVLRMAAHAGNEKWLGEMRLSFLDQLRDDPSFLAVLASEGRVKDAVEWTHAFASSITYPYEKSLVWNAEVAQAVTQLPTVQADADAVFLSEVILSNLPDPPKPDQASIPNYTDRRKRMLALTKRMKDITFTNPEVKRSCLEEFGQQYYCYEPLSADFDEAAAKVDIAALAKSQNSQESYRRLKPMVASIGRKLWSGDTKAAIEAYDRALVTDSTQHEYYRKAVARNCVWDALWAVPYQWSSQQKPDRTAMLAFVDHILTKTPDELYSEHVSDAVGLKLLIHHLEGHPEAITAWRKTLTVDRAQKLNASLSDHFRVWAYLDTMNQDAKLRSKPEDRAALVGALLKDEWIGPRYPESGTNVANLISTLTKDKAFKPEEIPAVWKILAEALPRKGRTAGEAADVLAQRGLTDEALAAFDLAISQSTADYATSAAFICRKAELLAQLKRDEEASSDLLALDEKKMGPGAKSQRAALLKRLQQPKEGAVSQ
ncbi:tetratricopeptide repeat protein [Roseimicrobium sp. ORNL1]|uniref:tetratricopeptide repeat protein n=1 Tax=Roseimicrobium sp. ORNL1 TaxID=2711231 RepID=UPI0013E18E3A|nr:tetratricopeptide repeat protein [Roseimicrobium sp. ORNL1]QIF02418.1 tetratricopeptide repeat protein [Roseimicrobium sp. ORNL1]